LRPVARLPPVRVAPSHPASLAADSVWSNGTPDGQLRSMRIDDRWTRQQLNLQTQGRTPPGPKNFSCGWCGWLPLQSFLRLSRPTSRLRRNCRRPPQRGTHGLWRGGSTGLALSNAMYSSKQYAHAASPFANSWTGSRGSYPNFVIFKKLMCTYLQKLCACRAKIT
jgi:hypothetical protein